MTTIRLLLSLASIYNGELKQLYIKNVFLHGELKEDVYMVAPPRLTSIQLEQICKLSKPAESDLPNCHPFCFLMDLVNL